METEKNISWTTYTLEIISLFSQRKKESACVTVYKNSVNAHIEIISVCVSAGRETSTFSVLLSVPNLIWFFSNLRSLTPCWPRFSQSRHRCRLWALRAAKGGVWLSCGCHGDTAPSPAGPICLNGSPWTWSLLPSSASFIYVFCFSDPGPRSAGGVKAGKLLWKTGSHAPPTDNVPFHCQTLTLSAGGYLSETWSHSDLKGRSFIVWPRPRLPSSTRLVNNTSQCSFWEVKVLLICCFCSALPQKHSWFRL